MKTKTLNTAAELSQLFNPSFQPREVKSVNGIIVNDFNGSLINNHLTVSRKHVILENYSIAQQSTNYTFLNAPFTITY